ncbi:Fic/DOC domain protein [Bacteriovorax sp. BSW11_IV]|uniref:Fic family protein n=1 Tax=Bacteriovorax sp. BSW11_IV TaxID=1353529 RepID=UPI000389E6AC|nr:Fic family protein [Bacteriovorax sp. BSW11_IV]EQC49975.1 Fic/DOC domain protein [Bacteriovorax sp. BSW11_IV]
MINKTSEEILEFLSDFSYKDDEDYLTLCREVLSLQKETQLSTKALQKMTDYRIISSSTLWSNRSHLEHWDSANKEVFNLIQSNNSINHTSAKKLNFLLTNNENNERVDEIFAGPWKYLEFEFLSLAKERFENEVLTLSDPIQKAIEVYIWLINLHPFKDGNGRTARLSADLLLLQSGLLPLCFNSNISSFVGNLIGAQKVSKKVCVLRTLDAIKRPYEIVRGG